MTDLDSAQHRERGGCDLIVTGHRRWICLLMPKKRELEKTAGKRGFMRVQSSGEARKGKALHE